MPEIPAKPCASPRPTGPSERASIGQPQEPGLPDARGPKNLPPGLDFRSREAAARSLRDYWTRQFAAISSQVEPAGFTEEPDGSITVDVHQVVHDARTGDLISDSRVRHRYRLEDGLVVRMDVLEPPDQHY